MNPFFPERSFESVYALPLAELYEEGLRGIVFDIDNTLVPPDAPADERSRELVRRLRALGFRICLVSNNRGPRVQSFAEELGLPFVAKALKPRRYGYRRAMRIMRTRPEETVSVGDQLFTDIWGANRTGMHSVLVAPMERREELQIRFKRLIERPFLHAYRRAEQRRGGTRG